MTYYGVVLNDAAKSVKLISYEGNDLYSYWGIGKDEAGIVINPNGITYEQLCGGKGSILAASSASKERCLERINGFYTRIGYDKFIDESNHKIKLPNSNENKAMQYKPCREFGIGQ